MKLSLTSLLTIEKKNKIAEWFILLFIAECTIGCSGRWFEIGPLSIRMVLFILAFLTSFPVVIRNIKKIATNNQVIITCCFGLYLLFCAWIGFNSGNKINFIISDVTTLLTLALFPGFICVMCNRQALEHAMNMIFWLSASLATITVFLHFFLKLSNNENAFELNLWLNNYSLGGMAILKTGIHRIFLKSQIFLQVAIVYGIWLLGKCSGKKRIIILVMNGIIFSACIISYTRGFWLGLAVSALVLLLIGIRYWKIYLKSIVAILAVFTVFISLSSVLYKGPMVIIEVVNRFSPDLIVPENTSKDNILNSPHMNGDIIMNDSDLIGDIIDDSNQASVNIRADTFAALFKNISKHPIIGNGLGANLDGIRNDGKTEYMYLDMMMKTGGIGMILFIATFFGFIIKQVHQELLRKKQKINILNWDSSQLRNRFLTAAYIGVAVTSFFNPFLNNPMGIILLMLTATAVYDNDLNKCEV